MIIFDLDGTLANCEHRRHFVEKNHPTNLRDIQICDKDQMIVKRDGYFEIMNRIDRPDWKPDWKAFYEACDQDIPIRQTSRMFVTIYRNFQMPVQIWSGRCESVRQKTLDWFVKNSNLMTRSDWNKLLKMRPIGDNTPDDQLKERWLDEVLARGEKIEFVFDDSESCCNMWNRRDIMCFLIKDAHGCNKDH